MTTVAELQSKFMNTNRPSNRARSERILLSSPLPPSRIHNLSSCKYADSNFQLDCKSNGQLRIQHTRLHLDRIYFDGAARARSRLRCLSRIKVLFLTYKQPTEFYGMNGAGHSLEHNNNLFSKLETSLARSLSPDVFAVLTECSFFHHAFEKKIEKCGTL